MSEPLVCAIMLTKDRPEMARRAVECFRAQTYENKRLLILDTSHGEEGKFYAAKWYKHAAGHIYVHHGHSVNSIGWLRNCGNGNVSRWADVYIHWDDDDLSHPNRIAEQVAYLQGSGAECVGYFDGLFWDSRKCTVRLDSSGPPGSIGYAESVGEAYIFRHSHMRYVLGASMCYWRSAWERRPFPDVNIAEDTGWMFDAQGGLAINTWGCSSFAHGDPRIVHEIHGGNTNPYDNMGNKFWSRTPEWDDYCRRTSNG